MDTLKKYWKKFTVWFETLSGWGKFWFAIIIIAFATGGWTVSLVIIFVWWIVSANSKAKKHRMEQEVTEAKEYLAPIIESKTLPVITVDVNLQQDEKCCYMESDVPLAEERSVRVSRGGGASFRVTKGVWAHSYSSRSVSQQQIARVDNGTLFVTNKRLIYLGGMHNKNIKFSDILATHQYRDAICVSVSSGTNGKNEYFLVNNPMLVRGMLTLAPYGEKLKEVKDINLQFQIT